MRRCAVAADSLCALLRPCDKMVVISIGRIKSCVKYPEVADDLFQCGYDVMIIDHRGQGLSGRLLADSHWGHVLCSSLIMSVISPISGNGLSNRPATAGALTGLAHLGVDGSTAGHA